ncbi:MAG: TolB family protein [Stellaceae bacterium]
MVGFIRLTASIVFVAVGCSACNAAGSGPAVQSPPVPTYYPDDPACRVKSVKRYPTKFESLTTSPASGRTAAMRLDRNGVYQIYVAEPGKDFKCITCTSRPGTPAVNRNKMMLSWDPSGKWLFVGVEETKHDLMWLPTTWQRGFMNAGIWLNMWITTPSGDRWYQMTDFDPPQNGPANGYVGVSFTPDGRKAVWAEIVNGNIFANAFGVWRLHMADFYVDPLGTPHLANQRDITPAGARWVEPGNFSPDGRHLLLSMDIGLADAEGQDQWTLDIDNGELRNLTRTPKVWDEHGLYSPSGKKIVFMSSYPYRDEPNSYKTTSLKTEFMLMDADGSHLQQLTHFNVPGYPESQGKTIAAEATFIGNGSQLYGNVMAQNGSFTGENWIITFAGRCGDE